MANPVITSEKEDLPPFTADIKFDEEIDSRVGEKSGVVAAELGKDCKDSRSSSSSSSDDDRRKRATADGIEPPTYSVYKATFEQDEEGVTSYDEHLNEDGEALYRFLAEHGSKPPKQVATVCGFHTETRTRTVRRGDHYVTETYTVIVNDFLFVCDLTPYLLIDEEPTFWSDSDKTPAWRGGMKMQTEMAGPVHHSQRTKVDKEAREAQEAWERERAYRGIPPWKLAKKEQEPEPLYTKEGPGAVRTELSSRTMREWADDYATSPKKLKDFKTKKVVYGWDLKKLEKAIENLIRTTGYNNTISVIFSVSNHKIHVRSSSKFSKMYNDPYTAFLLTLICVFPAMWAWRRLSKNGGGEWDIGGTAFTFKKWERVEGTYSGETVEACRQRLLGVEEPIASSSSSPPVEYRRLTDFSPSGPVIDRATPHHSVVPMKAEADGVYELRGKREGDWFKEWAETIRMAVINRVETAVPLSLNPMVTPEANMASAGAGLDGM